jgi:hypothetical protein
MNLDSQYKLNNELMEIYDSIKEWRSFDNGYTNNQYSFAYTNLQELNERFRERLNTFFESDNDDTTLSTALGISEKKLLDMKDVIESFVSQIDYDEDEDYVEQFMYDLASIIREYDGHTYNDDTEEESDNNKKDYFYNRDYKVIEQLKSLAQYNEDAMFLEKMKLLLSEPINLGFMMTYKATGVSAATYFSLVYYLLLDSIEPPAPLPSPAPRPLVNTKQDSVKSSISSLSKSTAYTESEKSVSKLSKSKKIRKTKKNKKNTRKTHRHRNIKKRK